MINVGKCYASNERWETVLLSSLVSEFYKQIGNFLDCISMNVTDIFL